MMISHISIIARTFSNFNKLFNVSKYFINHERLLHAAWQSPISINQQKLLQPASLPVITQHHGMKVAGKVTQRCPSCKLMWRKGRIYNLCKEFPRHNQMSTIPNPKSTWILTWASQSPRRPW